MHPPRIERHHICRLLGEQYIRRVKCACLVRAKIIDEDVFCDPTPKFAATTTQQCTAGKVSIEANRHPNTKQRWQVTRTDNTKEGRRPSSTQDLEGRHCSQFVCRTALAEKTRDSGQRKRTLICSGAKHPFLLRIS